MDDKKYVAHISDLGGIQTVEEHCKNVAQLARDFSVEVMKDISYNTGLAHDVGKYSQSFQDRILKNKGKFEHSICGAIEVEKLIKTQQQKIIGMMMEYCIAGHHSGLPDYGSNADLTEEPTLLGRLKREKYYKDDWDFRRYKDEILFEIPSSDEFLKILGSNKDVIESFKFWTRYLFSCLTDADFLDTESFCNPEIDRTMQRDFDKALEKVNSKLSSFKCETELQKSRADLQKQAFENINQNADIHFLNMPTGSGKTLCALKLALEQVKKGKKRIIYVCPYTSIIEQTADTFENILNSDGKTVDIVQHHSNFSYEPNGKLSAELNDSISTLGKVKRATENWDYPIVVTTNVQFFESLYHYKSSKLRKLHNLADSVIIFDEIHLLPMEILKPCIKGIGHITTQLNSTAIFLSATMPDYDELFDKFIPNAKVNHLIKNKEEFKHFEKCRYHLLSDGKEISCDSLLTKACEFNSTLIVVNKRKTASELYKSINFSDTKKFHLSTNMTPAHRSKVVEKIRKCIENNEKIIVVSTSLIEAGVDLDFECVFRGITGLDSIIQAGGRCNREGKRGISDVFVFRLENDTIKNMELAVNITESLFREFDDVTDEQCILEYYKRLHKNNKEIIDFQNSQEKFEDIKFRERFEYIEDNNTISVVVLNCEKAKMLYDRLLKYDFSVKRELQRYSVSMKYYEFEQANKLGIIRDDESGVFVLSNESYYDKDIGLDLNKSDDIIF